MHERRPATQEPHAAARAPRWRLLHWLQGDVQIAGVNLLPAPVTTGCNFPKGYLHNLPRRPHKRDTCFVRSAAAQRAICCCQSSKLASVVLYVAVGGCTSHKLALRSCLWSARAPLGCRTPEISRVPAGRQQGLFMPRSASQPQSGVTHRWPAKQQTSVD